MSKPKDSDEAIKRQLPLHYWVFKQKNQKLEERLNNPNIENDNEMDNDEDEQSEDEDQPELDNETDASKLQKSKNKKAQSDSGSQKEEKLEEKSEDKSEEKSGEKSEEKSDPVNWIENKDIRGRTPLLLAVTMGHKLCARTLMQHNANIYATDRNGFNVYHEALTTQDNGMVQMATRAMERCRIEAILKRISDTFDDIASADNFYVEIKCEYLKGFDDVIQIWKQGSKLRVDNQISDIDRDIVKKKLVKRRRSMIFLHSTEGGKFYDVNHATKSYSLYTYDYKVEQKKNNKGFKYAKNDIRNPDLEFSIDCQKVNRMMNQKIELITICTDGMRLKEDTAFLHSMRTKKQRDAVLDTAYHCKVFKLKGGQREVKSRREHRAKEFIANPKLLLEGRNQHELSLKDYFSTNNPDKDIGLTPIVDHSSDDLSVLMYVTPSYPLDWKSQIVPVFELLSQVKGPLQHLNDLTKVPMPEGFPVKFEMVVSWYSARNYKATFKFTNPNALFKRPHGIEKANVIDKNKSEYGLNRKVHMDEVIFKPEFGFTENKFK